VLDASLKSSLLDPSQIAPEIKLNHTAFAVSNDASMNINRKVALAVRNQLHRLVKYYERYPPNPALVVD
jgi:hypothetical protein